MTSAPMRMLIVFHAGVSHTSSAALTQWGGGVGGWEAIINMNEVNAGTLVQAFL